MASSTVRSFRARAARPSADHVTIAVPFDPAEAWGRRERYHLTGTINGVKVRALLMPHANGWRIELGPKSGSAAGLRDGDPVEVELRPEGPQADMLAADIAEALAARPKARDAFDSLATFYRKGWLRWIDATKRRPDVRAARIAEMVKHVEGGLKERP